MLFVRTRPDIRIEKFNHLPSHEVLANNPLKMEAHFYGLTGYRKCSVNVIGEM